MLARHSYWPSFFARIVARLQWDADTIDLSVDARAWPEIPADRRRRLTTLLAGFLIAEEAVAAQLEPFSGATHRASIASDKTLVAWVLFLQRRDEERHAVLFDRIAAEVLGLPGADSAQRRAAARAYAPAAVVELFGARLPALAAEMAAGRAGLGEGVGLYHMVLEGIVLYAGQQALLEELADGVLPGVREGVGRVELDERWHIGFGLRCLVESEPSPTLVDDVLSQAHEAASAWGDVVSPATSARVAQMCSRRLSVAGLATRVRAAA